MGDIENLATYQSAVAMSEKQDRLLYPFFALVNATHSDQMTCDLQMWDGGVMYAVPILAKCGINSSNEIWGALELPQQGDYVLVMFVGPYTGQPIIVGTVFPFLESYFQSSQTPVNSSSKQFTKKILETNHENTFRRIFKSGTSVEVAENGSVTIETPSGSYIQMDESGDTITIEAKGADVNINTSSSGTVNLNGTGDYITKYTELNTQLQSLISALNAHVHTSAAAGSPTTPPVTPMSLNISTAQSSKVQVGG